MHAAEEMTTVARSAFSADRLDGSRRPRDGRTYSAPRYHLVVGAAIGLMAGTLGAGIGAAAQSAAPNSSSTLTACPSGCDYTQVADAVTAARGGDVIKVLRGTYQGGFAIDKSLTLSGAGAGQTTIRGGGPVITIGRFDGSTEPIVTVRGVTITGGSTHRSGSFGGTFIALGGGIWIPPAKHGMRGATVTISDSVITRNRVAPTSSVPSGLPCPNASCPFALAGGGGIDNWGTLTVLNTTVSNNETSGGVTSDADGAGIDSHEGHLTLAGANVSGNRAVATGPMSRFAEGGGIMVDTFLSPPQATATLTVRESTVTGNSAQLVSSLPSFAGGGVISMSANGGGIHVGNGIPVTVDGTQIADNSATATDLSGEPVAFDGAMLVGISQLTMRDTRIEGNRVTSTSQTSADVGPTGGVLELDGGGSISNTRITGNSATAISPAGVAAVTGGLTIFESGQTLVAVRNTVISDNQAVAQSSTGSATTQGAGVYNNGPLQLSDVSIADNFGKASAPTGIAQGGGIWNGFSGPLGPPPPQLTLLDTSVTDNVLAGSSGISLQGGGLFTTYPVTLTHADISDNTPDQCFGC